MIRKRAVSHLPGRQFNYLIFKTILQTAGLDACKIPDFGISLRYPEYMAVAGKKNACLPRMRARQAVLIFAFLC